MTALAKLVRTTAFRLTVAYALIFAIISLGVLGYVAWSGKRLVEQGMRETVAAEVNGLIDAGRRSACRQCGAPAGERARDDWRPSGHTL